MKNIKKYVGAILLYGFVFVTALWFFVVTGFDGEALILKLQAAAAQRTPVKLDIGAARVSFPASVNFRGVTVSDNAEKLLRFKNLTVNIKLASLLFARPTLGFITKSGDGFMKLDVSSIGFSGKNSRIKLYGKNYTLDKTLASMGGQDFPLHAELDAEGTLELQGNSFKKAAGKLKINLKNPKMDEGFFNGLLKNFSAKSVSCEVTLENRMLKTDGCMAETSEGKFELRVSSRLANLIGATPLRGLVVITPDSGLLKKLLSLYPKYRKPNGKYHIPLKGSFNNPRIDL
ncbi:MAG: hypothetical protein IEMM0002_0237 [bacterium]|nr:MAG: hypothetical protein IEMM0002_0237 [bacterium]